MLEASSECEEDQLQWVGLVESKVVIIISIKSKGLTEWLNF